MPTDVRDLQELKNEDLERHEQPKLPPVEQEKLEGSEVGNARPQSAQVDDGLVDKKNGTEFEQPSKIQEVEDSARQIDHPAQEPIDRTADLLLRENELSKEGISAPVNQERPAR